MTSPIASRHPAGTRELRYDFASADRDHDGRIDFQEFVQMLTTLDAQMTEDELRIGFSEVDTNHDGLIDVHEFMEWWTSD
jgi:Ca2+-binding EF-hand superfamily protein